MASPQKSLHLPDFSARCHYVKNPEAKRSRAVYTVAEDTRGHPFACVAVEEFGLNCNHKEILYLL